MWGKRCADAMVTTPAELAQDTDMFLRRMDEALASGDPRQIGLAADELVEAAATTLPAALVEADEALAPAGAGAVTPSLRREALGRRVRELDGLARQLSLAVTRGEQGKPDLFRLVALVTATRKQLGLVRRLLVTWAGGRPLSADALSALRVAREALSAGLVAAGLAAADHALYVGLTARLDLAPDAAGATAALARWRDATPRFDPGVAAQLLAWGGASATAAATVAAHDEARAWQFVDDVEQLVQQAAMSLP